MPPTVSMRRVNLKPPKESVCSVVSVEADDGSAELKTSTCTCRSPSTKPLLATSPESLKLLEPAPGRDVTLTCKEPVSNVKSDALSSDETVSSVAGFILALVASLTPTTPVVGEEPIIKAEAFFGERGWEATILAPA